MAVQLLARLAEIIARDDEDALWATAEAVRSAEQADRVSLALFSEKRFTIVAHAGRGLLGRDATLLLATSTHFTTAAAGRAYVTDDFDRQPEFTRPVDQLVVNSGFRSGCSVPMWVGDTPVGALSVSCADDRVPAADRLSRLEGVAAMLAAHLRRAPGRDRSWVVVCSERALLAHGVARLLEADGIGARVATSRDETAALLAGEDDVSLVISEPYFAGRPADHLMQQVRRRYPAVQLAVLSEYRDDEVRAQAAAMGGFLLGARPHDVRTQVRDLLAGRRPPADPVLPSASAAAVHLTRREKDVLVALDRGLSVRLAARALGISDATVKGYLRSLFEKLGVHSRTEALHRARMLGLLDSAIAVRADL
ncbi:LuxR C-terminal-related transcriptional regulator [Streptomyces sp. NPDC048277]|uniref:LuxR C-terminal-related transcriptional regulator n=1 Tax=Streptomyces sp. NPDC048277 TaxID=3155027 RepID=UPI00340D6794